MSVITVRGARLHNLKNVSFSIPKNRLVVFSGVSGSGKSTMAFDTLHKEGQRQYMESLGGALTPEEDAELEESLAELMDLAGHYADSYGFIGELSYAFASEPPHYADVQRPEVKAFILEGASGHFYATTAINENDPVGRNPSYRHGGKMNVVFFDGHITLCTRDFVKGNGGTDYLLWPHYGGP